MPTQLNDSAILDNPFLDVFGDEKKVTENDQKMLDAIDALDFSTPTEGKIIEGRYAGTTENEILFDIGFKDYVRVENKASELKVIDGLEIGDSVNIAIIKIHHTPEYTIQGSISVIAAQEARSSMLDKLNGKIPVNAFIREMNPAGYILEVYENNATLIGFMPNTLAGANRISDPSSIVGQTMDVMIESYSKDKGTYILSRKKLLAGMIKEAINDLELGKRDTPYCGVITGSTKFGVFVEFNECLTGMIYESNFSEEALKSAGFKNIQEIPDGTEVDFYVKDVLSKNNRIILTQTFNPSLWDTAKMGDTLKGTIKAIKQFGALVKLDKETQGLIHSSELEKSGKDVSVGDTIEVKIISMSKGERKIYLRPV